MLYTLDDTIVAVATPPGKAGLGVVRLSGARAIAIVQSLFSSSNPSLDAVPSHTLVHGWITDGSAPVDEVLACAMHSPHSYTGEDVVEITGHGNPVVLQRIVKLCCGKGARAAGPGEFTFRAFVHGKLDLSKAEAVEELVSSATDRAAADAVLNLKGALHAKAARMRQNLVDLLSALEVALDYGEEDIRFLSPGQITEKLSALRDEMLSLARTADKGRYLRQGIRTVIAGRPNAGKSSLLNALLERERAIVTDVPGTTRDVIEELLDVRGVPVVLLDTAGIRQHTADPVEKLGHERALGALESADVALWVIDASAPLTDEDRHIAGLFASRSSKVIQVLNKIDLGRKLDDAAVQALYPPRAAAVALSCRAREGFPALEEALLSAVDLTADKLDTGSATVNDRQRAALDASAAALAEAAAAVRKDATEEIIAFHVRDALHHLGEITGETATDEILANIFSKFCVGK